MEPVVVAKGEIQLIGLGARTTNQDESGGNGKIPGMWGQFYGQAIAESIPNKVNQNIIGLYTDYENGVSGSYSFVIGCEVSTLQHIPEPLLARTIPSSTYAVFTTRKGAISEIVPEAWQYIWNWFENSAYERTFTGDFEYYDERSLDPVSAVVDIFVAIK